MEFAGWSFDYRYKLLGSTVENNGVLTLKFDIKSELKFPRKNVEDAQLRKRKVPIRPEEWSDSFGPSLAEYERDVNMPLFTEDTTIIIDDKKDGDKDES